MDPTPETPDTGMDVGALLGAAQAYNQGQQQPAPQQQQPTEAPPQTPQEPTQTQQPEAKPADDGKPKKPWDKIAGEVEEAKPEEKKTEEGDELLPEAPPNSNKQQKDAWNKMAFEAREAKRQLKAMEAQIKEFKEKPPEFKLAPEIEQELEELRTFRAASDVRSTQEWVETVTKPLESVFSTLKGIAEFAKIDAKELEKATDPEQPWQRAIAIKKVFETAEEPVPQEIVQAAILEAEKLHPIYAKAGEMEAKAQDLWRGLQNKTEAQRQQEMESSQKAFAEARTNLFEQIKTKFPGLFKNEAVAKEVSDATIGETPEDQAYNAMAGQILPHLSQQVKELREEVARLKKSGETLLKTRPNGGKMPDVTSKPKTGEDAEMDESGLQNAIRAYTGR